MVHHRSPAPASSDLRVPCLASGGLRPIIPKRARPTRPPPRGGAARLPHVRRKENRKAGRTLKEKNRAEEWFRAKHDELAGTARANLAAHDLEPGQEAYHLDSLHYATAEQMEAICPTGIDFDRYATLANGSVGYDEADAHWADAAWWDEQARAMWDEVDDIPDDGLYWTSVED